MKIPIAFLEKHRTWTVAIGLALLTLLLFWPALGFDFIHYDDYEYVKENLHVHTGLTIDNIVWAFGHAHSSNWHPLTWISHMMDVELFGLNPAGPHAVNVLFHTFNTVLLFFVVKRLTGKFWQSAIVAGLFAWHPLHVQSVAWISERKDVLSAFFAFWVLLFYARYVEGSQSPGQPAKLKARLNYVLSLVFFALGLMSKPMLVTLPLWLLLLDFWPFRRYEAVSAKTAGSPSSRPGFDLKTASVLLVEKIPFFALTLGSILITLWAQKAALRSLEQIPLALRLQNAPVAVLGYIGKTIWPTDLAILYPFPHSVPFVDVAIAVLLLAFVTVASFRYASRFPSLPVGWFWFLVGLVPVIGIVQVGNQSMADRYTYLPLVGLFVAVVWLIPHFLRGRGLVSASVLALGLCWVDARSQLQYWKDDFTMFKRAAEVTDGNVVAYDHLSTTLVSSGQTEAAMTMYREAVRLNPREADLQNNFGQLLARTGNYKEAIEQFNEAIRLNNKCARAYSNRGAVHATRGEFEQGMADLLEAVRLAPDDAEVHINLANVLLRQGNSSEALSHYKEATRLEPENPTTRYLVAKCLAAQFPELAIEQFREALKRHRDWLGPLGELAWLLSTHPQEKARNGAAAIPLAQRACELTQYSDPKYLGVLDVAYAEAGQFGEAITTAEKGRAISMQNGQAELTAAADGRLALYRSGKPFHQQ